MSEQYTPNLGHEPEPNARRDCVHIALAPVVAGEGLDPGWHVYTRETWKHIEVKEIDHE